MTSLWSKTYNFLSVFYKPFNISELNGQPLSIFQEKKEKDKSFVPTLFQALQKPGTTWPTPLLEKAICMVGPDEMQLPEVQRVLATVENNQLFLNKQFELNTLLIGAIEMNNFALAQKWIQLGAQVNGTQNEQNKSPLLLACQLEQEETIRLLLGQGASVQQTDSLGNTPLHLVVKKGSVELIQEFIHKGADIHLANTVGATLVFIATDSQNVEAVKFLLGQGASAHAEIAQTQFTPLSVAVMTANNQDDQKLVSILLTGKNIEQSLKLPDCSGRLPLHYAAEADQWELFTLLKNAGSPIEASPGWNFLNSSNTKTLLIAAHNQGEYELVLDVIKKAIADNSLHRIALLPDLLIYAAVHGNIELVSLLLAHKVKNGFDLYSATPFISAIFCGQKQCAALFPSTSYDHEYLLLKRVAHYLGLKGEIELGGRTVRLTGGEGNYMRQTVAETLVAYQEESFSSSLLEKEDISYIANIFESASIPRSPEEIVRSAQQEPISLVPADIEGHAMVLVFFKDENGAEYMALINRALIIDQGIEVTSKSQTVSVWNVDMNRFTPEIAKEILRKRQLPVSQGLQFFYKTLPSKLSPSPDLKPVQDSQCKMFSSFSSSLQKVGNCTLASAMGAVRFIWALVAMKKENHPPIPTLVQQVQQETKSWSFFAKSYNYTLFLKNHKEEYGAKLATQATERMAKITQKRKEKTS